MKQQQKKSSKSRDPYTFLALVLAICLLCKPRDIKACMLNALLAAAVQKRGLKNLLREECGEETRGRRKSSLGMILSSQKSNLI